ncbi:hypothetical protein [Brevundimonas sp.]|uniref:hypothetical protein n=1 Tax=Brevundimonas sp. TaxID=1871086 RepID=UPI0035B37542
MKGSAPGVARPKRRRDCDGHEVTRSPSSALLNAPPLTRFPAEEFLFFVAIQASGTRFCAHDSTHLARDDAVTVQDREAPDASLRAFIEAAFPTVWALETLLRLHREPDRSWTADALVADLRASGPLIEDCLRALERAGLIAQQDGTWRFQPASATLADLVEQLARTYAERPFSITGMITRRDSGALRGFADSFRLGGWRS